MNKTIEFEVAGKRDEYHFFFRLPDEEILKALSNSHPHIEKVVRGALCKKFVEKLSLYLGRETTLEEAHALCRRVR
jgi:hypothetical protein